MIKSPKSNNYFTSETEAYIVAYNRSTDHKEKEKIFQDHIYYPFYKLAENIIHTFQFYYIDSETIENLKYEIVSVLLEEKIHKFDPYNGARAYSYFGTIVKRWLINYNYKNYKRLKKIESFKPSEESYELEDIQEQEVDLSKFIDRWIEEMYSNLEDLFPKLQDRKIADAVLLIFKSRQDLDLFKKKAIFLYIREITDCSTPSLTRVITKLKSEFYSRYERACSGE